jgi:colanic acid/amylovoran biosynthesis glycosyltransferase
VSFYGFDAYSHQWLSHWGRRYPELFARGALFVAEGPAMAERLIQLGAPRDRVRLLPLSADVSALDWRAPRVDGPIRITMAGRLVEKKGFRLGIEAFARLGRSDATLTIVGSGPDLAVLKRVAAKASVSGVRFIPFLSRQEYRVLLAESDILLQPSLTATNGDSEGGAPTVLLDAQAIGTVIVASDHADIPYVVDPGAAYLGREGDIGSLAAVLATAVDSRDDWEARSRAGRQHVEDQHAPRQVAARRDEIYADATRLG